MQTRTIQISDAELNYAEQGSGPGIVFVHGFPFDHRMWIAAIGELQKQSEQGFRCIAPDLRGFGKSSVSDVVSIERFAGDIDELLTALGISDPIFLCGLSMGGYVSLQFARKFPHRLAGLILCDTKTVADSQEVAANRRRTADALPSEGLAALAEGMISKVLCEETLQNQPKLVRDLREQMISHNPSGIAAAARAMADRGDSSDVLPSLECPLFVLCGDQDAISPPQEMKTIAESAPNSHFALVPKSGHLAPLENPAQWARILLEMMNSET